MQEQVEVLLAGRTERGRRRRRNKDRALAPVANSADESPPCLLAVAKGMGRASGSQLASFCHSCLSHPEHCLQGVEPHYVGEHWYFAKVRHEANEVAGIAHRIGRNTKSLPAQERDDPGRQRLPGGPRGSGAGARRDGR